MRISARKITKLRSGQTVYSLWGQPDPHDKSKFLLNVRTHHFIGKRKHNPDAIFSDRSINHFRFVRRFKPVPTWSSMWAKDWLCSGTNVGGVAYFTTLKSAERFVAEMHAGLHPRECNEIWWFHHEMDMLDESMGICDRGLGGYVDPDDYPEPQYQDDDHLEEEPPFDPEAVSGNNYY